MLPYCDDFLLIIHGPSAEVRRAREREAKAVVTAALERLGLTRQPDKGQWEGANWIHHLGLRIESEGGENTIRVTPQRVRIECCWWVIAFGRVRTWQSFRACASVLHSVLVEDRRRIRPAPSQRRSG